MMTDQLGRQDKELLGAITTRDEAGRHFTEVYDGAWLDRMEALGFLSIHRPIHEATEIPYSQEYYTVEVAPEVANWFDANGDLLE